MPLKALKFKPGIFRENTRYTAEGGWYDGDKVRFRSGQPEKIGGWQAINYYQFLGVCRSLWPWNGLSLQNYIGVGTNLKYYVNYGLYNDITPIREVTAPGDVSFSVTAGSNIMTVTDNNHGCVTGDFVTFSGATGFGGNVTPAVINQEYQVTVLTPNTYTVTLPVTANVYDGIYLDLDFTTNTYEEWVVAETAVATYQINTGSAIAVPQNGWGAGGWGSGGWGTGSATPSPIRLWNAYNYGEDLIFGPKGGGVYYWDSSAGFSGNRGVNLVDIPGAQSPPTIANYRMVSDQSRIVLVFGTNEIGSSTLDPMLVRWSDQEDYTNWLPAATNQAGSIRLSRGSQIKAVAQVRQEILVWTDIAIYGLQYLDNDPWWQSQLLGDNLSIASDRAWAVASGVTYWMGDEKFYIYNGRVQTLPCDLRLYIFSDFNYDQIEQVFASTVEQFSEVWWFYCSANSTTIDKYVVYNYIDQAWYYGTMARTAWVDDSVVSSKPMAADYNGRLLNHEVGVDDNATETTLPIEAYITSSETDIEDGHNFGFIWRVLPDVTFAGSEAASPSVTMSIYPLQNSGSGYTRGITPVASTSSDMSVAGDNTYPVTRITTVPVERFTGQVNVRVRGRQISFNIKSTDIGVQWQLGTPRIDIRPDGRKS